MKITRDKGIIENASAPTSADVYRVGTIWVDTTNDLSYTLTDVTAGVSTWLKTAGIGSGSIDLEGDYLLNDQTTTNMMSKGAVYRFDGVDDVINIGDVADLEFNTAFTVLFSAKFPESTISATNTLLGKYLLTGNEREWMIQVGADEKLTVSFGDPSDGTYEGQYITDSAITNIDEWNDYAITYSAGTVVVYVNCVAQAGTATTIPTSLYNGTALAQIGAYDTSTDPFGGEMSMVRADNFAMSLAQIKNAFSGNIPFKWQYGSQTELVTNGDMELDANWADLGTPTTNERSSTQAHGGTYSRKFTVDAAFEGIKSDALGARVIGKAYKLISWVYPDDSTTVKIAIRNGDNSGWLYDQETTGLTQDAWNKIEIDYIEETSGSAGYIQYNSGTTDSGTWYIDDVSETKSGAVALYDQTSISETTWYDKANGNDGAVTGAEVLNAPSVTPLLALHMDIVRLQPGGTPGTNINCTQLDGISWNQSALTDTTNLAKDGTGGSFSLNAGGDELLIDVGNEVVGIVSCEVRIHDLNSSHATETYVPLCVYISGGLRLSFYLSGTAAKSDMTTILDAGDLVDVQIAYVTAT